MDNQRVMARTLLEREQSLNGGLFGGIGTEPINGLGWKGNNPATP